MADKWTESTVLDVVEKSALGKSAQGENAVFLRQVPNLTGYPRVVKTGPKRTIDGLRIELWPSRGLRMDAYEVKVSRSDLQHEVDSPEKSETWASLAHRFWIVVPDKKLAEGMDWPGNWGLAEVRTGRLRVVKEPVESPPHLSMMLIASIARSAAKMTRAEYQRGLSRGREDEQQRSAEKRLSYGEQRAIKEHAEIEAAVAEAAKLNGHTEYEIRRALTDPTALTLAAGNHKSAQAIQREKDSTVALAERLRKVADDLVAPFAHPTQEGGEGR